MFKRIQDRFGTAGLIVGIIALVAAMSGAAIAANGGLSGKQKKEVEKIAKKFPGAPGPAGKDGAPGTAGAGGAPGAKGDKGDQGVKGDQGAKGDKGAPGVPGSPWTAGGVLPSGATETGAWSIGNLSGQVVVNDPASEVTATVAPPEYINYAISFPVPLSSGLSGEGCLSVSGDPVPATCHVHYINSAGEEVVDSLISNPPKTTPTTVCTGTAAAPTAPPGHLCVYQGGALTGAQGSSFFIQRANEEESGASTAGAIIRFNRISLDAPGSSPSGRGTWAVTAEA